MATAFTLARIISNIPLARGGPASVVIFDIHALQAGRGWGACCRVPGAGCWFSGLGGCGVVGMWACAGRPARAAL